MESMRHHLREAYDRRAGERDAHIAEPWKIRVRRDFLKRLQTARASSLLEIGPGPGATAAWFRDHGLDVVCADLSPENVRLCREKGLAAHVMDATRLAFPEASFDAVYTMNCLLHLPKLEFPLALREIRRVLRPGSLASIGVYGGKDHEGIWEADTYEPKRFFSFHADQGLLELVGREFTVLFFERFPLAPGVDLHYQSLTVQVPTAPQSDSSRPLGPVHRSARIDSP